MLTGALALLQRALRLDARLLSTHLLRLAFVLIMYGCLCFAQALAAGLTGAPGLKLFSNLLYLNLILIGLAGVSFFATAITEEKEEGTLALLRLAGLNPVGLLLGKSTSRLIGTLLLLAIQLPFILLAVTLGGATIAQILAGYACLAAFLVLTANLGLLASVICRRGGTASIVTALLLLSVVFGGRFIELLSAPLVAAGGLGGKAGAFLGEFATSISPMTRIQDVLSNTLGGSVLGRQVVWSLLLAGLSFLLAWAGFSRFNRPGQTVDSRLDLSERLSLALGGRRPRPRSHAVRWKEFQFVTGGLRYLALRFVAYVALLGLVFAVGNGYLRQPFQVVADAALLLMLVLVVGESCLYASRLLHDEWRDHTLPSLMMLPVAPAQILADKLLGCLPALIPGLLVLIPTAVLSELGREHLLQIWYPSRVCVLLLFALLLTLTLFFSLVVRWGALPLASAVMTVAGAMGSCCIGPLMMLSRSGGGQGAGFELGFLIVDVILVFLIGGLQFDIVRRLEIAGSQ
jgi:ABC-type transport system involved in multi-copper enzyme maturation permease subunit